jgi:Tol biopolymer transport system component
MGLAWTLDGRIIYLTNTSDQFDLVLMHADGSDARRLSVEGYKWYPNACADNHTIVFSGIHSGEWAILRADIDGSSSQVVTDTAGESPNCSPDGKWVVWHSPSGVMKVPISGGKAIPLTDKPCDLPGISPDGESIACLYSAGESIRKLAIVPATGGPPTKIFDLPATFDDDIPFSWTPDGNAIGFADKRGGTTNVWLQSRAGGVVKQLTHFTSDGIVSFAWSRDGKQIAFARGTETRDVVLITGFE